MYLVFYKINVKYFYYIYLVWYLGIKYNRKVFYIWILEIKYLWQRDINRYGV